MTVVAEDRISRHEIIGLNIVVTQSSNPLHLGIKGVVVDETKNMLVISDNSKKKHISKDGVTYGFTTSDGTFVEIDGRQLLGRSVDRIGKNSRRRRS